MKHIFVFNSVSASKRKRKKLFDRVIEVCKNEKLDYDIYFTRQSGGAFRYASEIAASGQPVRFYGCGGDGTISELAAAVANYDSAEFTAISLGTGNDFIRNFGNKKDFLDLISLIYGNPIKIDLIRVNERYCANITNIGFDRRVVSAKNRLRKLHIVPAGLAYIGGVILSLIFIKKEILHFTFEDGTQSSNRLLLTLFANGAYYGGGFKACAEADLTDGIFDLMIVPPVGRLRFLSLVGRYKKGEIMQTKFKDQIIYRKCKSLEITKATPIRYCLDGEILTASKLNLEIVPAAARFVVPADLETDY